jgi:hypothetical protein
MSPTRRDVLKAAAALPVIAATMSRSEALAELAKPAGAVATLPNNDPDTLFDPASFANRAACGSVWSISSDAEVFPAAKERAEYAKARYDFIQVMPELARPGIPCDHPFVKMDECMWAIANASYDEGVRAGAAFERLRLAAIGPMQACPTCEGLGLVDRAGKSIDQYSRPHPHDVRTCLDCKGNGTVAVEVLRGRTR